MPQQYTSIVTAGSPVLPAYAQWDNYPTIQAAMSASLSGGLVLVMPGVYISATHNNTVHFSGKNLTIAGVGLSPDEVQLRMHETNRYGWFGIGGETVLIENLHIHRPLGDDKDVRSINVYTDNPATATLDLRFHRVRFSSNTPGTYGLYYGGARFQAAYYNKDVRFTHCQLDRPPGNGYQFRWTPLYRTRLEKCVCPGGLATFQTSGAWALNDSVAAAVPGYGLIYADAITPLLWREVQGQARDVNGAAVRVVGFVWDRPEVFAETLVRGAGDWTLHIPPGHPYGIYYVGGPESRFRPVVHGPYPGIM